MTALQNLPRDQRYLSLELRNTLLSAFGPARPAQRKRPSLHAWAPNSMPTNASRPRASARWTPTAHATVHLGGVPMIADDMLRFVQSDLLGVAVLLLIVATLTFSSAVLAGSCCRSPPVPS